MNVRELIINLLLNCDPTDTVEVEVPDPNAPEFRVVRGSPKRVFPLTEEKLAVIECEDM